MRIRESILFHKILKRCKIVIYAAVIVIALYSLYLFPSRNIQEDTWCYKEQDRLQPLGDTFTPFHKAIFFHETSCKGSLDARQECAVESAARAHPDWQINVLFTAPINTTFTKKINETFKDLTNVEFRKIDLYEYAKDTPAWSLVSDGRLLRSRWRISHTSDVLRYVTLYKWGGIYLDLDVIVVKSLEELSRNWAVWESESSIGAGALRFSQDVIGRQLAHTTINELEGTFSGNLWGNNGPGVITRVLKRICSTPNVTSMLANTCSGFNVYNSEYFYPVKWQQAKVYFQAIQPKNTFPDAYGYHVWNKISHNLKIERNSLYDELAKKYCPGVYNTGTLQ